MATQPKKTTKPTVPAHEVIRVAPLHHPKLEVALSSLGQTTEDSELFDGKPHTLAATPKLVYNGGPLIKNTKVFVVYWGKSWKTVPAFVTLAGKLNAFFTAILTSPLMDQMAEYSRPGYKIGHGSFIGSKVITTNAPGAVIQDSQIRAALQSWITAGTVPAWDANTLYFIYFDQGVKVVMGGSSSCSSFCGYHDAIQGKKYYAVMPFPSCAGCLGGMSAFDALTGTSSHELCEAITDPVPGTGWYDPKNGEIGDICAWKFKTVAGYNVQLEWSNKANACI